MSPLSQDKKKFVNLLKKKKSEIFKRTLIIILLVFVSLAVVGTQIMYPYHLFIGITIYISAFVLLVRYIYLSRKNLQKFRTYDFAQQFLRNEKYKILIIIFMMMIALVVITVRPYGTSPFKDMSENELKERITDDSFQATAAMDYLESSGNKLLESLRSKEKDVLASEKIKQDFNNFLKAVMFSESLTETHRFFHKIPFRYSTERSMSFLISYSLYVKKYELLHRIFMEVDADEFKRKVLNENMSNVGRDGIYLEMVERFYLPKTRLRISGGKLYLSFFNKVNETSYDGASGVLIGKAEDSYDYLLKNFANTLSHTGKVATESVRSRMFETWFPMQKNIANSMGHIIISSRGKGGLIPKNVIYDMEKVMQPGDIMLQRRNWHLSNVGIPGFWTHAALYTGSLERMDDYFASEFPYEGYESMSDYMKAKYPEVWNTFSDIEVDAYSVIEAIEPGVVIQSLPQSADADFVVTLRPNVKKSDKMKALFRAFSHVGKPYDYNFDFDTKDTLVCSELVYDAYFEKLPEKDGVNVSTSLVNGRPIVSPLDMANKYKEERNTPQAELSFVYFIQGDEENKTAFTSTEKKFLETIEWSKFSFFQE